MKSFFPLVGTLILMGSISSSAGAQETASSLQFPIGDPIHRIWPKPIKPIGGPVKPIRPIRYPWPKPIGGPVPINPIIHRWPLTIAGPLKPIGVPLAETTNAFVRTERSTTASTFPRMQKAQLYFNTVSREANEYIANLTPHDGKARTPQAEMSGLGHGTGGSGGKGKGKGKGK
ncbi:MAG: hypothetical protein ACHQ2Z_12995 [Elusimicrobiota bacterium]